MPNLPEYAAMVRELRTQLNISARRLGYLLGIDEKTVLKWERGLCKPKARGHQRLLELYEKVSPPRRGKE